MTVWGIGQIAANSNCSITASRFRSALYLRGVAKRLVQITTRYSEFRTQRAGDARRAKRCRWRKCYAGAGRVALRTNLRLSTPGGNPPVHHVETLSIEVYGVEHIREGVLEFAISAHCSGLNRLRARIEAAD